MLTSFEKTLTAIEPNNNLLFTIITHYLTHVFEDLLVLTGLANHTNNLAAGRA